MTEISAFFKYFNQWQHSLAMPRGIRNSHFDNGSIFKRGKILVIAILFTNISWKHLLLTNNSRRNPRVPFWRVVYKCLWAMRLNGNFIDLQIPLGNVGCQATFVERLFSRRTKFPSHRHATVPESLKKQMVSVFKVGQGLPMIVSLWMAKHFVEKRVTWPGNNRDWASRLKWYQQYFWEGSHNGL